MRVVRKLVALVLYAAILLPGTEATRLTSWMRAVAATSTAFDSTMRRKRTRLESERLARDIERMHMDALREEKTLRVRCT
jgi:hypothetical protein